MGPFVMNYGRPLVCLQRQRHRARCGTDFGKMFARQPWNKPFNYELLDAFIQHQIADKQDATSSGAHSHEHPTMNRHIRL